MTLATLVVTHHSSMPARAPDPLAAVETADRAATAWALRDDEADEEEMRREMEKLDAELARAKKDAGVVAGVGSEDGTYEPRAPKRRAERVAHRSPFESESEEAPADADDDRAQKTAKRAHHRTASASGSESSLDLDRFENDEALEDFAFDTADAMDLEEYAGLARARRVKLEHFEAVLADEARMREMLRRAVAKVARGEAVRPVAAGDISRALGFEISSSLADMKRKKVLAEARQSLSAADASVGKAEDESESEDPESEESESTLDAGFEDATWAEDDYRATALSTKDPNAMNRLDPVASAPGAPSEKTDEEEYANLLKHVEENKATIAEQVIRDDDTLYFSCGEPWRAPDLSFSPSFGSSPTSSLARSPSLSLRAPSSSPSPSPREPSRERARALAVNRPNARVSPRRVASDASAAAARSNDADVPSDVPSRAPPPASAPRIAPATASASVACSRPRARARRAYSLSSFARA